MPLHKSQKQSQKYQKQLSIILNKWTLKSSCNNININTIISSSSFFNNFPLIPLLLPPNSSSVSSLAKNDQHSSPFDPSSISLINSKSLLTSLPPQILSSILSHLFDPKNPSSFHLLLPLLLSCKTLHLQILPFLYHNLSINLSKNDSPINFSNQASSMMLYGNLFHFNLLPTYARNMIHSLDINLTHQNWIPDFMNVNINASSDPLPISLLLPNLRSLTFRSFDYTNVQTVKALLNQDSSSFNSNLQLHLHNVSFNALIDLFPLHSNNSSLSKAVKHLGIDFSSNTISDLRKLAQTIKSFSNLDSFQISFDINYPDIQLTDLPDLFSIFFSNLLSSNPALCNIRISEFPPYLNFVPYLKMFGKHSILYHSLPNQQKDPFSFTFQSMGIENEDLFYQTLWSQCAFDSLTIQVAYSDYSFFQNACPTTKSNPFLSRFLQHLVLDGPQLHFDNAPSTNLFGKLTTLMVSEIDVMSLDLLLTQSQALTSLYLLSFDFTNVPHPSLCTINTSNTQKHQPSLSVYSALHSSFLNHIFQKHSARVYSPKSPKPCDLVELASSSPRSICISPHNLLLDTQNYNLFLSFVDPICKNLYLQTIN